MIQSLKKFFGVGTEIATKATGKGLPEPIEATQPAEGTILKQQFITQIYAKVIDTIGKFNPKQVTIVDRMLMRQDPDVAFGTAVIRGPIINAEWSVESEDPVVQAFIDAALRPHYPQIARATGVNEATVRCRVSRGLRAMQTFLQGGDS